MNHEIKLFIIEHPHIRNCKSIGYIFGVHHLTVYSILKELNIPTGEKPNDCKG